MEAKQMALANELANVMGKWVEEKGEQFFEEVDNIEDFMKTANGIFYLKIVSIMGKNGDLKEAIEEDEEAAEMYNVLKGIFKLD